MHTGNDLMDPSLPDSELQAIVDAIEAAHPSVVSFRELLLAPGDKLVREVMHEDVITVPEEMDQEAVARLIAQHEVD